MKVILLTNVAGFGKTHEVKDVKDGYGKNMLIRKGLAELATPKALASLESRMKGTAASEKAIMERGVSAVLAMDGKTVTLVKKANEEGHLFAAIHEDELYALVKKEFGADLPEGSLQLKPNTKSVGEHKVGLSFGGKEAVLNLNINKEE